MNTALAGFVTGLGLIVAIGSQNVFVLRQGIARRHVLAVALTATLCDAALITAGVAGLGSLIASVTWLAKVAGLGGALFLVGYGFLALRSASTGAAPDWEGAAGTRTGSVAMAIVGTLAVSLLNPHVYLDTVVLLGGIGGQLEPQARGAFTVGAVAASAIWFFSLAFGARALAPWFRHDAVRRALDLFVALVMFVVAGFLIAHLLDG